MVVSPNQLLNKNEPFNWTELENNAFLSIREGLKIAPF